MTDKPCTVHVALVHFPVLNKAGEIVTSSVTTLDVHDISRACRTFEIERFYMVTPLKTQQDLVQTIIGHWQDGYGGTYNPTRKEALGGTRVKRLLADVIAELEADFGEAPKTVVPDAKRFPQSVGYGDLREAFKDGGHFLLIFGTGWGLEKSIIEKADYVLEPIEGPGGYNHLPVRGAISIILDRLLARGER